MLDLCEGNLDVSSRDFLICDYCYWVASGISTRRTNVVACPRCKKSISRIPLTPGEIVTVRVDNVRGIELGFSGR